ncbi:2-polyprenyl-6-methoxyphenol hydroxylase-like FAD-dependent oxidoreductase [Allocatelliglobosispora scoriae]|uniref:2-polyprenyl-6-methoxyphenol hydroxylase-like FAD-dependent oxidoreductase n=1 Tax=Allocatelliglobosispora scoriae TaxID=643052 RepID=A0A841BPR3_9ACTN|nr:NAD(P)/FAD-dependent oxidoreductase [Allocatelliglobosispora scoriae]MBB5868933.1 2-polyprenyl-6-methoxyphenol hydroxylase-like FAD-dependent oxidoreductase [Allocatelliglobosispora scoriae]
MAWDVIVVGTRVAGAATAMLLARRGLRVLAVDRVAFPSDTVSSHQIQVPGVALLHRWGLLDRVRQTGAPPTRHVRFDSGDVVLAGSFPAYQGVDALYSPRRTHLDALLIDAARSAGAEVRDRFRVADLVWSGGRVTGVRGWDRGGAAMTETATLVIGADGKRSFVAEAVGARRYRERPVRAFASYGYWSGLPMETGEVYQRPGRAVAAFPTSDELTMVYVSAPIAEFEAARGDLDRHYLATLDGCGDLGERVRGAVRAERLRTTPDQPNTFRRSHGPGWALVGDAGVVMDSISAQGITNAFRDAELLSDAVAAGLDGGSLDRALAGHQRRRDRAIRPMFDFTMGLAGFAPRGIERALLRSLGGRQGEIDRFLGAFAGSVTGYFTPVNVARVIGVRGLLRLAALEVRREHRPVEAGQRTNS